MAAPSLADLQTPFGDARFVPARAGRPVVMQRSMVDQGAAVGDPAGPRLDRSDEPALQREVRVGENDAERRPDVGQTASPRTARARQRQDDLLHLPLVVGDELLRLPPVADGEREDGHAALRRNDHAKLDLVQLPGPARRRLHAGRGRNGHRQPHRPGPLVERRRGELGEHHPRVGVLRSSRRSRRRGTPVRRSTRTCRTRCAARKRRPAPTVTCPPTATTTPSMAQLLLQGTNFVNFMGRFVYVATGKGGVEADRRDREGRAAGGDRQRPAQACLSEGVRRRSNPRDAN